MPICLRFFEAGGMPHLSPGDRSERAYTHVLLPDILCSYRYLCRLGLGGKLALCVWVGRERGTRSADEATRPRVRMHCAIGPVLAEVITVLYSIEISCACDVVAATGPEDIPAGRAVPLASQDRHPHGGVLRDGHVRCVQPSCLVNAWSS